MTRDEIDDKVNDNDRCLNDDRTTYNTFDINKECGIESPVGRFCQELHQVRGSGSR